LLLHNLGTTRKEAGFFDSSIASASSIYFLNLDKNILLMPQACCTKKSRVSGFTFCSTNFPVITSFSLFWCGQYRVSVLQAG
jgi:hypothetical protein